MLQITIPAATLYNSKTNELYDTKEQTINLEHSLVSVSKWESIFCVPFIDRPLSKKEFIEYVRCMTITKNVDPLVYHALTLQNVMDIKEYMERPMTASTFSGSPSKKYNGEFITSETLYYLMFSLNISMECQKWHLNRLLTLIRFCQAKNTPAEKMTASETAEFYRQLNEKRKKEWGTKG